MLLVVGVGLAGRSTMHHILPGCVTGAITKHRDRR